MSPRLIDPIDRSDRSIDPACSPFPAMHTPFHLRMLTLIRREVETCGLPFWQHRVRAQAIEDGGLAGGAAGGRGKGRGGGGGGGEEGAGEEEEDEEDDDNTFRFPYVCLCLCLCGVWWWIDGLN